MAVQLTIQVTPIRTTILLLDENKGMHHWSNKQEDIPVESQTQENLLVRPIEGRGSSAFHFYFNMCWNFIHTWSGITDSSILTLVEEKKVLREGC